MALFKAQGVLAHQFPGFVDQLLAAAHIHEAPGQDLRIGQQGPGLPVEGDHHGEQAVLAQQLPVPQHHVADIPYPVAVHHDAAGGHLSRQLAPVAAQLHHAACLGDEHMVLGYAHFLGQLRVLVQMPGLPMDGDEEAGIGEAEHELQFLPAGVAGYMDIRHAVIHHRRPVLIQLVDDAGHAALVARDAGCGNDHHIPLAHVEPVGSVGHAEQAAHGFPLGAGGDDAHLVVPVFFQLVHADHALLRQVQISQLPGDGGDVLHAPALEADHPPIGNGQIRDLLDPINIRCKGGHDDPALGPLKAAFKGLADLPFRGGMAALLHVGAVAHQGQHPLGAVIGEAPDVDGLPVDGGIVHLEVPGVDNGADGGIDGQGAGPGDGVAGLDELHVEAAQPYGIPRAHAV